MSLLYYEDRFARLNPNRTHGEASPHKVAMLLAVMELIAREEISENVIAFSEKLKAEFTEQFKRLKSPSDRDNPHLPFFHLRSSGFWHHAIKPGKKEAYERLSTASGPGVIDEHIVYAYLDDELFELLNNYIVREYLKTPLYSNLEITDSVRKDLLHPEREGWDWLECELCVRDYFDMLHKELRGEAYNKTEHRRKLAPNLNDRSEPSIERKHMNISAVLIEMGFPYIPGYKPYFNYQSQLRQAVLAYLAANPSELDDVSHSSFEYERTEERLIDWQSIIDNDIPEKVPAIERPRREYLARKISFSENEAKNKILGLQGEKFVKNLEKRRLAELGREDLAEEVQWSSQEKGDGLGYDVRSFQIQDGEPRDEEHFIEVKTTNSGRYQPFLISDNEVAFSKEYAEDYSLYRLYDFSKEARLFALAGAIDRHVHLRPTSYRASWDGK